MSTLRKGKHTVAVQAMEEEITSRGLVVQKPGAVVTLSVNVQPLQSAEAESIGVSVSTSYRLKYFPNAHGGVPWPGGAYSRITWQGREYDQVGEATLSSMSSTTSHYRVVMKARESQVK